jgi:SH3 domain protein
MLLRCFSFALVLLLASPVFAATAWVGDEVYVPVRAGAGNQYRIVHRGIKSGTRIEFLGTNGDWAHIRYGDIEGYIGKQYVSSTPTAGIELEKIRQENDQLKKQKAEIRTRLSELEGERQALSERSEGLQASLDSRSNELEQLRTVAADPIRLDQANRRLNEELSMLRSELDQVKAENAMLRNDATSRKWLTGVGILILGLIAGLVLRSKSGRRRGSWSN